MAGERPEWLDTEPRKVDVGRAGSSFFINVTSGGFGAEITATTPVDLKKALGGGAYTLMGLVKAMNLKPYTGRLLVPGEEPIEGNLLFGAVGNNHFAGGGFDIAPHAKMDDGLLDLTAIMHSPGFSLPELARELADPTNPGNRFVAYRQLAEFTIESDQKLHCNLDGEPVAKKRLRFKVLPGRINLAYRSPWATTGPFRTLRCGLTPVTGRSGAIEPARDLFAVDFE